MNLVEFVVAGGSDVRPDASSNSDAVIVSLGIQYDPLDLGNVSSGHSANFKVFVSLPAPLTVQAIGILDPTSGISVEDIQSTDVLPAYSETSAGLLVSKEGKALLDTRFFITFITHTAPRYLNISGYRGGAFFLFDPNWAEGVTVERRFLTSVFESANMSQSRKVLRDRPLRSVQATLTSPNKFGAGVAWAKLRDGAKQETAHPWYPDKATMTQGVLGTRVYCPTEYRRFQTGGYAFLARDVTPSGQIYYEIVQIDTVFVDGFSTVDPATKAYVAGDAAYPAYTAYASLSGNQFTLDTDSKGTFSFTAEEVYGTTTLNRENDPHSPVIRKELPVFSLRTTFSEDVSINILMGGESADSGRGRMVFTKGVPYMAQTATALALDKQESWELDGFFNYLRGRGKPFWVKSELDFMSVTGASGNTIFSIDNINTVEDMDYLVYCWVTDSNGDFDILSVAEASEVSEGIQITLEANSLADIVSVRQAHAVRLDEDVVTTEYLTDEVSLTTFTVVELQKI